MIVFELTMPHAASWNGKWSGGDVRHIIVKDNKFVPKELWNRQFEYRWDDGWCACVSVTQMPAKEARALERRSNGFWGYEWMVRSILKYGFITTE